MRKKIRPLEIIISLVYTRGAHMDESKRNKRDISPWEAMGMTWDILATILILTAVFAFGGVMVDRCFGTKFIFTIVGFILLVLIGYRIIMKKAKRIAERLEGKCTETNERT